MAEFDIVSVIPWAAISFIFGLLVYIKRDAFTRGKTDATLESKNILTSTLLTNAIKQLESQSDKIDKITEAQKRLNDSIIEDLYNIKTDQAVMKEKLRTIRDKVFSTTYNREQEEDDSKIFENNKRR